MKKDELMTYFAIAYYILKRVCKKSKTCRKFKYYGPNRNSEIRYTRYEGFDPLDLLWIIREYINIYAKKNYSLHISQIFWEYIYDFDFDFGDGTMIVPEFFELKWEYDYKISNEGWFQYDANGNGIIKNCNENYKNMKCTWKLSEMNIICLNKAIRKWKYYGRYYTYIDNKVWQLSNLIKKYIERIKNAKIFRKFTKKDTE